VSINVWRLEGDTLNITCNFLYCNHQVHREFLFTLYNTLLLIDNEGLCLDLWYNIVINQYRVNIEDRDKEERGIPYIQ
jgi:hypothetical protein